jgi:hypothetical protein
VKRWIVVLSLVVALPAVAWAQAPSNEELYQMIKEMERKLDKAIDEANKAKAEADKAKEEAARAKEEAAKAKEELARIKETPAAAVPAESLVRVPETKPGISASAEVVYLRPSRSNLDFVIRDPDNDLLPEGRVGEVEPDYGWGGRFGLSYDFGSGTDISARVLWIKTHDSESAARPAGGALWGTWLHPNAVIDDDDVTSAKAGYDFEHYVVDLGVGQWVDIGKHLGLRIDAGLRYANMAQDIDITYRQDPLGRRVDIANENDFSGWGGRIGLGLDWRVGWGFNVFSSVAGSVLVGDFDLELSEVDNGTITRANIDETIHTRVVPVIETQVGIGYTYRLRNGWSIGARAGYEWQNWFNMVTAQRFSDDVDPQLMYTDTTDIGLDGFFFKAFMTFR